MMQLFAGTPGSNGSNGTVIRTGSGAPNNAVGVNGDLYIRTSNNAIYLRSAGTYSVISSISGSIIRNGAGAPDDSVGQDGDYYLRTSNGVLYQRASGVYGILVTLKGADGSNGSNGSNGAAGTAGTVWYNDTGVPDNGLGVDGDYYIDNSNGMVYYKSGGEFSTLFRLGIVT